MVIDPIVKPKRACTRVARVCGSVYLAPRPTTGAWYSQPAGGLGVVHVDIYL